MPLGYRISSPSTNETLHGPAAQDNDLTLQRVISILATVLVAAVIRAILNLPVAQTA